MTQIDYILGAAIFLSAFIGATLLVLNFASAAETDTEVASMRAYATSLLDLTERSAFGTKISERGIGTVAWRTFVSVNNPGSSTNEESEFRFSEVGFGDADLNSIAIYTSPAYGASLPFTKLADTVKWSSEIPPGTTVYTLWFDDDSSFSDRSSISTGSDNYTETVFRPEPVWVIQHDALQALTAVPYQDAKEASNFRIRLIETGSTVFSYGLVPTPGQNVIVASKPALYQKANADIGLATMTVEVWI